MASSVRYVSPEILRRLFREHNLDVALDKGRLREQVLRDAHLERPQERGEPLCTHSQYIRYLDEAGNWVVEVHRYRRPDGTLGGSGRPDPKRLRVGGVIYVAEPNP